MPSRKHTLSDNEANPSKLPKSSRIHDGDGHISGPNASTQKNIEGIEKRPQRTNRGQGGVGHQLAELEKKLRPDLQPQAAKKSKTAANIPDSVPANRMAPQAQAKPVKSKRLAPAKDPVVMRKEDPPLGHGAPKPSQHKVTTGGTRFGFQASVAPTGHHAPTALLERERPVNIRATSMQVNKRVTAAHMSGAKNSQERSPPPSAKVRVPNHFQAPPARSKYTHVPQEIVPDSEPERAAYNGNDNDNSMPDLSGGSGEESGANGEESDANGEESDANGENTDASEEEDDDDPHLGLEAEALAEMEMDSLANEPEDDLMGPNHNQDQGAMAIDEDSPDEDDRRALAALQNQGGMDDEDEEASYSVLEAHHNTNRKVRAPDSENLTQARNHQSRSLFMAPTTSKQHHASKMRHEHEHEYDNDGDADNEAEEAEEETGGVLAKKRATRNSQESEPLPTQMQYYRCSAAWTDILEQAKHNYRLYIHTTNPFPERNAESLRGAGDCVTERIAAYEDDPRNKEVLDEDFYNLRAMSSLVFEDGTSYRGQLKTQCRLLTAKHFADLLEPDCPNQLDYTETVQSNAKQLRKKGFFLQGGRDENDKTRNFGNSLIATVCKAFYYSKKRVCLNLLFPRDFDDLPQESLAMIANCIDEYLSGTQTTLKFDGENYAGVHKGMMILIARTDEDEYHGPRLRRMLRDIARTGRMQSNTPKSTPQNADLDVVLD